VRAALERDWEFIGHGFTQRNMQKVKDERADICKTRVVIADTTGKPPRGWLGPGTAACVVRCARSLPHRLILRVDLLCCAVAGRARRPGIDR
jgi:hypothetical protein